MIDSKRLVKALNEVGAQSYQVRMAATLLAINGIENALEFVYGLQAKGLTSKPQKPQQGELWDGGERG